MKRLYALSLLIFLLSLLMYGIFEWHNSKNLQTNAINTELNPDFIAETLKSDLYNKAGQLSFEVKAQRMEHYADLDFTHFEFPQYTLYPKNQTATWQITANEATLQGNNRIVLESRVLLKATDSNSLIQEIHCKYLELDLNTNIISSDQAIMVQGKDFTMYGSGLIVDLNTTQMTLTEHVQTIYKKTNS
jgi:lipopolysaccharide export system protein LptC